MSPSQPNGSDQALFVAAIHPKEEEPIAEPLTRGFSFRGTRPLPNLAEPNFSIKAEGDVKKEPKLELASGSFNPINLTSAVVVIPVANVSNVPIVVKIEPVDDAYSRSPEGGNFSRGAPLRLHPEQSIKQEPPEGATTFCIGTGVSILREGDIKQDPSQRKEEQAEASESESRGGALGGERRVLPKAVGPVVQLAVNESAVSDETAHTDQQKETVSGAGVVHNECGDCCQTMMQEHSCPSADKESTVPEPQTPALKETDQKKAENHLREHGKSGGRGGKKGRPRKSAGIEKHQCNICQRELSDCSNLIKHMVTHTVDKPHKCTKCDYVANQKVSLDAHMLKHTGERPHKCTECKFEATQKSSLTRHRLTHTGERPHKCTECKYEATQKASLTRHMLTHTGERPHKCKECGKGFARSSNLKEHLLTHCGVKPYKCKECGRGFIQPCNLTVHLLTHTGVKPYKCKECGKGFTRSSHLKEHLLTHSGVKPHKCKECGKGFAQSNNLTVHLRIHSGVKPYACTLCPYKSNLKGNLKSHQNSQHAQNNEPGDNDPQPSSSKR